MSKGGQVTTTKRTLPDECIYVMELEGGRIKLGRSRNPEARLRELKHPMKVIRIAHQTEMYSHSKALKVEGLAHRILMSGFSHIQGEVFEADSRDALEAIRIALAQFDGLELPLGKSLPYRTSYLKRAYKGEKMRTVAVVLPESLERHVKAMAVEMCLSGTAAYVRVLIERDMRCRALPI